MEVSELTGAILSDDYEEGEILDEDTLYDNVSSLEEFSGSETHGEISSVVVKKTSCDVRKEKHHKRKEHKCKEDSICRKERRGKHCYARIRKGKTAIEVTEKAKTVEVSVSFTHEQNQKKKSHAGLPPVHGPILKNGSRRLPMQKDLLEKENRCSHKYTRYYENRKALPHRIEKKKVCEKLIKKHLATESRGRSHDSRKRSKSKSPKLRNQLKEVAPRGGSSLLKRLVGSGSIGVKTPKEIDEPKKIDVISLIDKDSDLIKDVIVLDSDENVEEGEIQIVGDDCIKEQETIKSVNMENYVKEEEQKVENSSTVESSEKDCKEIDDVPVVSGSVSTNLEESTRELTLEEPISSPVTDSNNISNEADVLPKSVAINKDSSESLHLESIRTPLDESMTNNCAETSICGKNIEGEVSHNSRNQKNEPEIAEDIDELNLRLEALRTAMLRKHKERQKRGFICKKKSTLEDDSFTEYVLSNVEKDTSPTTRNEVDDKIHHTDCNGVSVTGDLLNPEDMVIDQNDKDDDDNECNILENFSYPPNYPLQDTNNVPLHYLGHADPYSIFPYTELNGGSVPHPHLDDNTDLVAAANRNITQDFPGYAYPNNQLFVHPPLQGTTQIPLHEEKEPFSNVEFKGVVENQSTKHSLEHCLKEINSNKESFTERTKRVRRVSAKLKFFKRKELDGKKWHQGRLVVKRKLTKREYIQQQKRRRRESIRDLKVVRTEREDGVREESDEESALRELALKSVKEKPKHFIESEALEKIDNHVNSNVTSVNGGEGEIFQQLQIEIDNNINEKPIISCDSESTPTNLSSSEPWDDIDEDILRAQLLSSLSSRMPSKNLESSNTLIPKFTKKQVKALRRAERKSFELRTDKRLKLGSQRVNKENFKKISKIKAADLAKRKLGVLRIVNHLKQKPETSNQLLGQNTTEVPVVPKFIISLNEDSSSDDEIQSSLENDKTDVVRSIDLFLQEARIENDLKQGQISQEIETASPKSSESKPGEEKHPATEMKVDGRNDKISDTGHGTPQVLKHLPAWQQEEYRRLKKQIAEKEKVLKAAKEKVLLPSESEVIKEFALSKNAIIKTNLNNENEVGQKHIDEIAANSSSDIESTSHLTNNSELSNNKNIDVHCTDELKTRDTDQQQHTVKPLPTSPIKITDRSKIVEEVNHMAKVVAHLEREMGNFRNLHKDIVQKKRELLIAKLNMAKKKKMLFEIKKRLMFKEKLLQAKIEESSSHTDVPKVDQNDAKKQTRRDLELCKLRMREFSLRTKMIFDEIENTGLSNKVVRHSSKGMQPIDKSKEAQRTTLESIQHMHNDRVASKIAPSQNVMGVEKTKNNNEINPQPKGPLSFSEKQSESWDPFVPVCPFDLSGVCKDEECKFQHIKAA